MFRLPLAAAVALLAPLVAVPQALAKTDQSLWPEISGVLLMNKTDSSRPLDARPGRDPFGGRDR